MRVFGVLLLAGLAGTTWAAPAYVTDELVLGVYADQSTQGQRLATLHSGASVETLSASGESTQVRLPDGRVGWVKTTYLTAHEPATVRIKQLQDELDRARATAPGLAEAAARSEVARLTHELEARQGAVDARTDSPASAAAPPPASPAEGRPVAGAARPWPVLVAVLIALACGYWAGYAVLARRIRIKFGGIKVWS